VSKLPRVLFHTEMKKVCDTLQFLRQCCLSSGEGAMMMKLVLISEEDTHTCYPTQVQSNFRPSLHIYLLLRIRLNLFTRTKVELLLPILTNTSI